ncbi:MAG: competence protein ComEC [Aliidongia sp.]|nr:competence protein ComEC [Aliidongia sp.]
MVQAVLGAGVRQAPPWLRRGGEALFARLLAERERWGLWLPVGFAAGIGLYFGLESEPWPWLGAILTLAGFAAAFLARRNPHPAAPAILAIALPLGVVAAGLAAAQFETWRLATPMIDHPLGVVALVGRVTDIETQPNGMRVTLAPDTIERVDPAHLPHLVRIKLRGEPPPIRIGDRLSVKAELMPPSGPALPGGFDFQRQAWFRGIGAVGYALGKPAVQPGNAGGLTGRIRAWRAGIAARLRTGLPGAEGSIAAAIVTGERDAIPALINQDYRDSGLSHLLVIAGLHMTLVSGFVFFAARGLLALIPAVALRAPIKKWAAAAALAAAALYLVLSGAAVPTERAFTMVALGLVAIMIDRFNLSIAAVAWAAGLVLALDPSALIGVSFQMSFAAVAGLIAFYETAGPALGEWRRGQGPLGRFLLHLAGIGLTTLVATLATAGFSIYHFNRFALFSILANLVAVPVAGFWVMPWAVASCVLLPFGAERLGLIPMGWGLALIEQVAHWTAGLPHAVLDLPTMPGWGLVAAALGGVWLVIWHGNWRYWGLLPVALAAASPFPASPPDILAAEDGRLLAIRAEDGRYLLSSDKSDKLAAEDWLRAAGGVSAGLLPEPGEAAENGALRCDPLGCVWHRDGRVVALVRDAAALPEDCRTAQIIVAMVPARHACRTGALVVDRVDLRRNGATAIWLGPSIILDTATDRRGTRPWVVKLGPHLVGTGQAPEPEGTEWRGP